MWLIHKVWNSLIDFQACPHDLFHLQRFGNGARLPKPPPPPLPSDMILIVCLQMPLFIFLYFSTFHLVIRYPPETLRVYNTSCFYQQVKYRGILMEFFEWNSESWWEYSPVVQLGHTLTRI